MLEKLEPYYMYFVIIAIFGCIPVFLTSGITSTIFLAIQVTALIIQLLIIFKVRLKR